MNKKTIIIWTLAVLGLLVLLAWAGYKNTVSAPRPEKSDSDKVKSQLVASETFYDFGTISMAKGKINKIFKITNPTDKDIMLSRVVTSCMCTNAYVATESGEKGPFGMGGMGYVPPANEIIRAGKSFDVKIVYDPNAHGPSGVGTIDRFVELTDADGGMIHLEIKALVTP